MITNTLMVQGTTSDAGKSILVTALCRVLARRQLSVAPFKPQNMALNSAVTIDGGEIGRAQALQAQACRLEPHTDMNPILLKPSSDTGAQVIVHGHALKSMEAQDFHDYKKVAMSAVIESHQRLSQQYEMIVVEGAGSPAEINLRHNDIANMGFAEAVDCPVILIADIDRGGVFAHLIGTLELLSETEQARVCGFVINRFRGDIALLQSGLDWLEERTGIPVLGVLPYLHGLYLDAEDAIATEQVFRGRGCSSIATEQVFRGRDGGSIATEHSSLENTAQHLLKVVVPVLSRISNHTDFDPLRLHPQIDLQFVGPGQAIPNADLIILPGSKNVRKDLLWLQEQGWEDSITTHLRYGGKLLGICGGYQMLGQRIDDPAGIEDTAGSSCGLGLLDMTTELTSEKSLQKIVGTLLLNGATVQGYEIHCGISDGVALENPLITFVDGRNDGAISADGQVAGTYLHGLFDKAEAQAALLTWAGLAVVESVDSSDIREQNIERLADCVEEYLDLSRIFPHVDLS